MDLTIATIWPLGLVIFSNVVYHITCKSTPADVHPMASLMITYAVAAVFSALLFFLSPDGRQGAAAFSRLNWTSVVLGLIIVGLEAGWNTSVASLIGNVCVAVILLFVGVAFFHDGFSLSKLAGVGLCLLGLFFLGR